MLGFGKAKYGKSAQTNAYQKFIKLEADKELIVRILPPMKSLENTDKWSVYYTIHYGYKGVDRKDPSKTVARPFRCVEQKNTRTGMITQTCPECMEIQKTKALLDERTASLSKRTDMTDEEKETMLAPLKVFLKEHNIDKKWYLNVMLQDGTFGTMTISHRTKKLVEALLDRIDKQENIDPLEAEGGVWLSFRRTGRKLDAVDTVEPVYVKEEINGRRVNVLKSGAMSEEKGREALERCSDLATGVVRTISLDQVNMLVNSSGDPEEVDRILSIGTGWSTERSATPVVAPKTPVAKAVAAAPTSYATSEDEEQALLAQLEAVRAAKRKQQAATPTGATTAATTVAPSAQNTVPKTSATKPVDLGLPEDKFLELFEDKG